ncbi:MAG: tetratricopeptide repeat protein [Alphaproteobacteria bacterium]|nr:tetratricopeptide repeat protein [Alphaproteobacteria bacterium]
MNEFANTNDAVAHAQRLAQTGDLVGATALLRVVVARDVTNFFALFMLGTLESHFGNFDEAEKHLARAVALNPRSVEALVSHGNALLERKRPEQAAATLDRALKLQPNEGNALIYRGLAAVDLEKHEDALSYFDRALRLDPGSIPALHNRANVLVALGRHNEALPSVDKLLKLAPTYVPAILHRATILSALKNPAAALADIERGLKLEGQNADLHAARGLALMGLTRHDDALASYDRAIALKPERADLHIARGNLLLEMQRLDEAFDSYERAIARDPKSAEAHLNCANVLMERGRLDDALRRAEKAIALNPGYAHALLLRANILLHALRPEEALPAYDAALGAKPDSPEAHYHRGSALLLHGRYKEGWRDFEYRWDVAERGFDRPELSAPEWRGETLAGKSLIVFSEQGLGDTIQFARFLPLLARGGAKVTFLCHPNLIRLFRSFSDSIELIGSCDATRRFDFQCALMSVPERLGVALENIPNEVPYLFAEEALAAEWRETVGMHGFKIGITWQGNPLGKIDRGRSIPLEKLAPLADIPGTRLICLQRNHGLDQLAKAQERLKIEALGAFDEGSDSFIDSAAIMQNLDLFVTSDTATAHLAGALGRPVWVVLKHLPDWRFMLGRSDSPWYPTMRLFRQPAPGDWDAAISEMADALRALIARRGA